MMAGHKFAVDREAMSTGEQKTARAGAAAWRKARGLRLAAMAAAAAGGGALTAGFFWYASLVPNSEIALDGTADGIVALTGGVARIGDAVELLASGHGKRLLITGVNPTTRADELSRLIPRYDVLFACCIDLGRSAVNTIGNAVETRHWVHERGFRSLIVVTSSYHMPRAMAELAHQLPDAALTPFPVVTDRQRAEPWWSSPASTKLLFSEYLKYIVAVVRMRLDPLPPAAEVLGARGGAKS